MVWNLISYYIRQPSGVSTSNQYSPKASTINGDYLWSNGTIDESITITGPESITITGPVQYWLEVETKNCVYTDTIQIVSENCIKETKEPIDSTDMMQPDVISIPESSCKLYVPIAIARIPKLKNNNLLLRAFSNCDFAMQRLQLNDRWGNVLFDGQSTAFQANLKNVNPDMYAVNLTYQFEGEE